MSLAVDHQRGVTAVAMSGGVDSSAVVSLLTDAGCDVFGVTAIMTADVSRCCAPEDVETAARVCRALGVEHRIVDVKEAFQGAVIDYFTDEYLGGRTPSPCVMCNQHIKFGALLAMARELGADRLASGHYARIEPSEGGRLSLLRGVDEVKDQSYFLARLSQAQLAHSCFPLGATSKPAVSAHVHARGLVPRKSKESQELCFVTDTDHGTWIDLRSLDTRGEGMMVDTSGRDVGRHAGVHHYTVGQRKGLGIALGRPVYVVRIDAAANVVVVGDRADAMSASMRASGMHWIAGVPPAEAFRASIQIRYNHRPVWAEVRLEEGGAATFRFDDPQFAVAPGQAVVLYDGEEVLGSGWID